MMPSSSHPHRQILTISDLNRKARQILEQGFGLVWVEAEISNLAHPGSGHWYFTLKDANSQVRCAMFRNRNQYLDFSPANGLRVLVRARVSVYDKRGDFQLIVEHMAAAGEGALQMAFEALKTRLQAEGLFDPAFKKTIPVIPRQLGVITSPGGAAIHDILQVLKRRHPGLPVIIYPAQVQGTGAAEEIRQMLACAITRNECDVLIIARGGGSLEDLWAFNDEALARALHACPIPVISGIGHETDFTIADFVADVRAPTPSAAAELASMDAKEWLNQIRGKTRQLNNLLLKHIQSRGQQTDWLARRLMQQHPQKTIHDYQHQYRQLGLRLDNAINHRLEKNQIRLSSLSQRLTTASPIDRISRQHQVLQQLHTRLTLSMQQDLKLKNQIFGGLAHSLHAVSPLQVLERGYSLTTNIINGRVVRNAGDVKQGDVIETRLSKGRIRSRVDHDA